MFPGVEGVNAFEGDYCGIVIICVYKNGENLGGNIKV